VEPAPFSSVQLYPGTRALILPPRAMPPEGTPSARPFPSAQEVVSTCFRIPREATCQPGAGVRIHRDDAKR
jgi:hypothetical protein